MEEQPEEELAESRMSLGDHLDELRKRLVRGLAGVVVAFLAAWFFYEEVAVVFLSPLQFALEKRVEDTVEYYEKKLEEDPAIPRERYFRPDGPDGEKRLQPPLIPDARPIFTAVGEGFIFALKISLYTGIAIGSPILLWQMWQFVAAGLYKKERKTVLRYFPFSVLLFASGVLFGYFVLMPWGFYFLTRAFHAEFASFTPKLSEYLQVFTTLTLALGAVFQLPILMHALVRMDLIQRSSFAKYRAHFVVAAFIVAAMLTPPDPVTQFMMAVPMVLLYELGLYSSRFAEKQAKEAAEETLA